MASAGALTCFVTPRARARVSSTLSAGAVLLALVPARGWGLLAARWRGLPVRGGGRDALRYGVSFATTRSQQLAEGGYGVLSLRHFGLVLFIPWRVGAEESGAAKLGSM